MNKTLMFIQADMHRAINNGFGSVDVPVRDLKELIRAVMASETREGVEFHGHAIGWINAEKLKEMREGKRFYCTIRRRKREDFDQPIFCKTKIHGDSEEVESCEISEPA